VLTIALGYLMMVVIGPDRPGAGYYVINREAAAEITFSYMLFAIVSCLMD